jgi:uncharacterized membrane protein YphA (DoxX/SURF4 family)
MNKLLWVLQILLALVYLAHGWMLITPPASLIDTMNEAIGPNFRIFIGVSEVLASIALIVPGLTGIMPGLTTAALAGLMIVMISAAVFHLQRGENSSAASSVVLLAIITFVAYERWRVHPLATRRAAA